MTAVLNGIVFPTVRACHYCGAPIKPIVQSSDSLSYADAEPFTHFDPYDPDSTWAYCRLTRATPADEAYKPQNTGATWRPHVDPTLWATRSVRGSQIEILEPVDSEATD